MAAKTARYREIELWLRQRCAESAPGTLLPAELDLARQFDVSRMTARQAMQNLAQEGLIDRRRGVGSFVAAPPLHRAESILYSFTDDMLRRGMTPSSRLLSAGVGSDPADAAALGLESSAWLVQIDRVRMANGVPVAREKVALPGEFSKVLDHDLETGSLHAALAEMGRNLGRANGYVMARLATAEEAELLDLELPAALLVETRLIFDDHARAVERTETAYVGARWVIDTGPYVHPAARPATAAPTAPAHGPRAASSTR